MMKDQKISSINSRKIFAHFDVANIRVYQAYNDKIAEEALKLGTFGPSFKMSRMTWIKTSFLWMMYRSGWAQKDGQNRVLAIDINRDNFESILKKAVLSPYNGWFCNSYEEWKCRIQESEVRCQWDPDRDIYGNPLEDRRAIQLGIRGNMVKNYVNNWIVKITDITEDVVKMRQSIESKTFDMGKLPIEQEYPLDGRLKKILGME